MLLTKNIIIILLCLRFSEVLAADENKQVFAYLVAALLEIIESHLITISRWLQAFDSR
jgi:hypothetical protein